MKIVPRGVVGLLPSKALRGGIDKLLAEVAKGPIGVQKWGQPVSLVLVSREEWEKTLAKTSD